MERNAFIREFGFASPSLDKRKIKKTIACIVKGNQDRNPQGHYNLVIVMEELAELQKEVSKQLRGRGDKIALTEETADVLLSLMYLQNICGITTEEIHKAMNVKIKRMAQVTAEKGCYQ